MNAGFFNVLHDAGDDHVLGIAEGVDVDFDGALKEVIDEDRTLLRVFNCLRHVLRDSVAIVTNHHGAASEHIAGTDEHRVADALADGESLFHAGGCAAGGLGNFELFKQLAETLAVFGKIDGFGRGADDGHSGCTQALGQIERGLSAELDNHADLCARLGLMVVDGEHVFERERLKVEAVAGVVVGGDGLRVAVDHDGLVAVVFESEGGVAAAVIELDALADAVGAGAENDDLGRVCGRGFVFFVVRRVEVGGHRLELGGARIYEFEDGDDAFAFAQFPHLLDAGVAFELPLGGDALVAQAETL